MTENCCLICKQDYQLLPTTDTQEQQVTKRLEDLQNIFGAHEDLKRHLHQITTFRSNNIESDVNDSSSDASTYGSLPRDLIEKKPIAAVDILDMIGTLTSAVKDREQELLLKSTILDNMKEHLSIVSKVILITIII